MADKNGALKCSFSEPGHSNSLLQGLAALSAQGQLLDVALTINREAFHAHKVMLVARSDYFRAMFTGGMQEASQDVMELKGGLHHIINFAYSAEVTLDLDCVQDVLGAAVFLQMLPVVELCEEFLKAATSVETCLHIGQMATAFSLASLRESVDAFTFRHFLQIAWQDDFLRLPLERLVFFLQSNQLQICTEVDLFRAAVRWLQHDPAHQPRAAPHPLPAYAGGGAGGQCAHSGHHGGGRAVPPVSARGPQLPGATLPAARDVVAAHGHDAWRAPLPRAHRDGAGLRPHVRGRARQLRVCGPRPAPAVPQRRGRRGRLLPL